jgi:hypothetical protein
MERMHKGRTSVTGGVEMGENLLVAAARRP